YQMPPKSSTGTRAKGRRVVETVQLSEQEAARVIANLPELSEKAQQVTGKPWRVRDRFIVAWETALRPATIEGLRAPCDYRTGATTRAIRDEIDKARFGREVPLSRKARAALDRCTPDVGPIFSVVDSHTASDYLRAAAEKAKLPERKVERLKSYDFRHGRLT